MQNIIAGWKTVSAGLKSRGFALGLLAVLMAFLAFWISSRVKTVKVDYNGTVTMLHTALSDPADILDELEIEVENDDCVVTSGFDSGFFGHLEDTVAEIRIRSAVDVVIEADRLTYHVSVAEGSTVGDALNTSGLVVRETDLLDTVPEKTVKTGDRIAITRIDYRITTEEETIERGSTVRGTSLLKNGRKVLLSTGKNGVMLKTYEQKIVDGVEESRTLVSEDIIKKPVNNIYILGDGSAISPLDYGYTIENGVPVGYTTVYENVRATGYYAKAGAGTASGRKAQVGYVAVDPKIIPYGTKLWIVGHGDSGFVYGYALAADTGGAMLSGKNFVDLYYSTYYECVLNGLKYVDVYVLE